MIRNYLILFILTIVIELAISYIFKFRTKEWALKVLAVNMITHPILYLIIYLLILTGVYNVFLVIILELIVVVCEWKLFEYISRKKSNKYLKLSFANNAISYILGLVIFGIMGF